MAHFYCNLHLVRKELPVYDLRAKRDGQHHWPTCAGLCL